MQRKIWLYGLALALAASLVWMAACGDDDDDDDDDETENDDDADDDDASFGSPGENLMSFCTNYVDACFDVGQTAAAELCEEYIEIEQECAPGATERMFECTGSDCDKWDECSATWEDEVNCK